MTDTIKMLALDPGSRFTGWAQIVVREGYPHEVRGSGVMHAHQRAGDSLEGLVQQVRDRVDTYDVIAIEEPGPHPFKNRAAATTLYQTIGAFRAVCVMRAVRHIMVPDPVVKLALAGREVAGKSEVHWALARLGYQVVQVGRQKCSPCRTAGMDDRHSPDAADAVALGHVAADRLLLGI